MAFEKDKTIKSTYPFGKGEVVFDTVNEFRLVSPEITAGIALAIQKWTDANLHYLFDINSLIPENIGKDDNLNRYSEYFVNSSYDLLKHNCVLTFNEALFILLGLYPHNSALPPFHDLDLINYKPFPDGLTLESVFYITRQYTALKRSVFVSKDGKINSENLIILANAEENMFFQKNSLKNIFKQKRKYTNKESASRNKEICKEWQLLSPLLDTKYQTKVQIYREIIRKQKLSIKEDTIGKIIAKNCK
jgi:hypothetical protein